MQEKSKQQIKGPEKAKTVGCRRRQTLQTLFRDTITRGGEKKDSRTRPKEDKDGRGGINVFVLDLPFAPACVPALAVCLASVTD